MAGDAPFALLVRAIATDGRTVHSLLVTGVEALAR
jgi:hypothetical protein